VLVAAGLTVSSVVADVDQLKVASARRQYFLNLQIAACDPSKASTTELSYFNNPGGMTPEQEKVLISEVAEARSAHLSVFKGLYCIDK
jgi:hypothetical protein